MYGASVRMKELLDEFLSRYRGTDKAIESCDLCELITSAVDRIALLAESQSVNIVQTCLRISRSLWTGSASNEFSSTCS